MKVAVTDACIFIDLFDIDLVDEFLQLPYDFHTTYQVFFELNQSQQAVLLKAGVGVYNFQAEDYLKVSRLNLPKSLTIADKSVVHVAIKLGATLLSSDKAVRYAAKIRSIDYHGMLWLFDQLIEYEIIDKKTAQEKLNLLIEENSMFRGNQKLKAEIDKRREKWT
ncbi:MAG: hypothetical protein Salg2KO_04180 [Salibacteraceae bacterium]